MSPDYGNHDQQVKTIDAYQEGRDCQREKTGSFRDNPYLVEPEKGAWTKGFYGVKL